jgi:nitrous oxide reductase accessory protein NosL
MKKILFILTVALAAAACNPETTEQPKPVVLDFESVGTTDLPGPTTYGDNLYDGF